MMQSHDWALKAQGFFSERSHRLDIQASSIGWIDFSYRYDN